MCGFPNENSTPSGLFMNSRFSSTEIEALQASLDVILLQGCATTYIFVNRKRWLHNPEGIEFR
jgi:hypothetical protein